MILRASLDQSEVSKVCANLQLTKISTSGSETILKRLSKWAECTPTGNACGDKKSLEWSILTSVACHDQCYSHATITLSLRWDGIRHDLQKSSQQIPLYSFFSVLHTFPVDNKQSKCLFIVVNIVPSSC